MASQPDPQLSLRAACVEDALCLGVLATQVFLDTYCPDGIRPAVAREVRGACSTQAFEKALSEPAIHICVAEKQGHLIGFAEMALGRRHALLPEGPAAELQRLYVQRPFIGNRLGTSLLKQSEDHAVQAGARMLWLTVWSPNQRARAFYAQRGFEDLGSTWFCFESESHENRLLVKRLQA